MKVSLYEAHRIISRINKEIDKNVDTTSKLNVYADVNHAQWFTGEQVNTANRISVMHKLIDARFFIRRLVQEMNETCGVNETIAEEKRIRSQLFLSENIVRESEMHTPSNAHSITRQAESMASNDSSRTTMVVYNVPAEIVEGERMNIRGFTRQLDDIRVKLTSLNHQNFIQLDSQLVEFLEEGGIV